MKEFALALLGKPKLLAGACIAAVLLIVVIRGGDPTPIINTLMEMVQ